MKEEKTAKKKKIKEPEYINSVINSQVLNYRVYYMSVAEKLMYFLLAFVVGAAVAYLFYGGIGSDELGNPTAVTYITNVIIMGGVGMFCGLKFLPIRCEQLKKKRKNMLRRQFMDLLDSLAASIASGNNAINAFIGAKNDLSLQYDESSMIVQELSLLIAGMQSGAEIEEMLIDFGKRSEIEEISNFARVFKLSYRKGGDFGRIIRDSYDMMYNKVQIEMEIETKVASTKNELNIMTLMPILLVGMIKMTGGDFATNFNTPSGIAATTAGIIMVIVAYKIGQAITDIEV